MAIHKFARLIEQNKPIPIYGDGSMVRDFTYIDDIIDGTIAAINQLFTHHQGHKSQVTGHGFSIYNLGNSSPISVNELVVRIEKALGKKAIKEYLPPQPGDVERTFADITKAARDLDYKPKTTLEEGLAKFVEWLNVIPARC